MNLFLANLRKQLPSWWNKRAPTEEDFYRICRRENIKVHEIPLRVPGYYMVYMSKRFIIINSALRGVRWLYVAFHELGHHFLHEPKCKPNGALFYLDNASKEHAEAEAFAIAALIPESLMKKMLESEEYIEDEGLSAELLKKRFELYTLYGF